MPSQTFFRLAEAKRQRLIEAAWNEFTAVSYMDASINRIIQEAQISRGSFYQYFSGKQELFAYLLETVLQTVRELFQAQLVIHSNDLYGAVLGMYDLALWKKSRKQASAEQIRVQQLIKLNADLDMCRFAQDMEIENLRRAMTEMLILAGCPQATEEEGKALFHLLMAAILTNLTGAIRHPEHEERNRRLLEQQLLLIRRGIREGATEC